MAQKSYPHTRHLRMPVDDVTRLVQKETPLNRGAPEFGKANLGTPGAQAFLLENRPKICDPSLVDINVCFLIPL